MFDRLEFVVSEAFVSMRRNSLLTLAAVITVSISLLLIGSFGYLYFRVDSYSKTVPNQFQMRVFLHDNVGSKTVDMLAEQLRQEPGIANVELIPKALAWAKMKAEQPDIASDLTNPLPDAFNIKFANLKYANSAAIKIRTWPEVDKVIYQTEELKVLQQGLGLLRYIGYLGLLLFLIGGIIIFNAIQFTIVARRVEIRIMQLVGASLPTIRAPFVIEGLIQGALGGVFASWMMLAINAGVSHYTGTLGLTVPAFPYWSVAFWLVILGGILGATCSTVATSTPLKYR